MGKKPEADVKIFINVEFLSERIKLEYQRKIDDEVIVIESHLL
jgi:hypothetical protein